MVFTKAIFKIISHLDNDVRRFEIQEN